MFCVKNNKYFYMLLIISQHCNYVGHYKQGDYD